MCQACSYHIYCIEAIYGLFVLAGGMQKPEVAIIQLCLRFSGLTVLSAPAPLSLCCGKCHVLVVMSLARHLAIYVAIQDI